MKTILLNQDSLDRSTKNMVQSQDEMDSVINQLRLFQQTMNPDNDLVREYLPDFFHIRFPGNRTCSNTVLIEPLDWGYLVILLDSNRKSVTGALDSVFIHFLLYRIIHGNKLHTPAEILKRLDFEIKNTLSTLQISNSKDDRLFIAVCQIDMKSETMRFSEAGQSILYTKEKEVVYIESNNKPLDFRKNRRLKQFTERNIKLKEGYNFYLYNQEVKDYISKKEGLTDKRCVLTSLIGKYFKESFEDQKTLLTEEIKHCILSDKKNINMSLVGFGYRKRIIRDRREHMGERRKNVSDRKMIEVMYQISKSLNDILFIKTEAPYCRIYLKSQKSTPKLLRTTFQSIEFHFKGRDLIRVHRCYLVNPKAIISVFQQNREHKVLLKGKKHNVVIPIGRSYYLKLKKIYPDIFI